MRLKDIINNVDKNSQFKNEVNIGDFAENFYGIQFMDWIEQSRLTSYYIGSWHCTDRPVGYKVYFFDDVPVAISTQMGRKCVENIEWVSEQVYKQVKEYVMSFEDTPKIELADLNQDIGEYYTIDFYEELYTYHKENVIYNNQKVKIVDYKPSYSDGKYHPETVKIEFENGNFVWVKTNELSFPYNLK